MVFHSEETPNIDIESAASLSASKKRSIQDAKCSLCGQPFNRTATRSFPFCSPRCRQIDLGNWLNESYGFPVESGEFDQDSLEE